MYLYTGAIEFAPFGSEEHRKLRRAEIVDPSDDKVPRPSPKSIYQLANKVCALSPQLTRRTRYLTQPPQYDVTTLKDLSLNQIRGELTKCDIVEESFSKFASRLAKRATKLAIY